MTISSPQKEFQKQINTKQEVIYHENVLCFPVIANKGPLNRIT